MMVSAPASPVRIDIRSPRALERPNDLGDFLRDHSLIEGFRELRRFLSLHARLEEPVIIATTAALYDEGASSLALGLAASLAYDQCGQVLLADCDFQHPSLQARLGLDGRPGVSEILAGETTLAEAVHETVLPQLSVLGSGQRKRSGVMAAQAMIDWMLHLRGTVRADYVVLDLPPANVDLGTRLLARYVDLALLVVRGGVTPRDELRLALVHLQEARVSVVVNGADRRMPGWIDRLARAVRGGGL